MFVEVPNVPSLVRCDECGGRGHERSKCPKLQSLVVRLLFKKPVCETFRQEMQSVVPASKVYVGMRVNGTAPNPMVHVVFATVELMMAGVKGLVATLGSLMVSAPKKISLCDERKECNWCGDSGHRAYACPMSKQNVKKQLVVSASQLPSRQYAQAASVGGVKSTNVSVVGTVSSASANVSASASQVKLGLVQRDNVCCAWRFEGKCEKGRLCYWTHPENQKAVGQVCFSHRDLGTCRFGNSCRFSHSVNTSANTSSSVIGSTNRVTTPED